MSSNSSSSDLVKCYACGMFGHTSRTCPNSTQKGGHNGNNNNNDRQRGTGNSLFRKGMFHSKGSGRTAATPSRKREEESTPASIASGLESMLETCEADNSIDERFGFRRMTAGSELGWLINMQPTLIKDPVTDELKSALDLYFLHMDLTSFKVAVPFSPYFYVCVSNPAHIKDVEFELRHTYESFVESVELIEKEDMDMKNHLSGKKAVFMKVSFPTVQALVYVRNKLMPFVNRNKERAKLASKAYDFQTSPYFRSGDNDGANSAGGDPSSTNNWTSWIEDLREFDVPYYVRVSIDLNIRVALWYKIEFNEGIVRLELEEKLSTKRPSPRVLAFDIETTKLPLKFPDPATDSIMMISYMADKKGYLIVNRETVSEDTSDFEYTPRPEFPGLFHVFNEPNEKRLLERFFEHIKELKPQLYVTFNGDFFDWPFVEARAKHHGISMYNEIGVKPSIKKEYYTATCAPHVDCFCWVHRDSYLPQGSQGLKAVTKAKLGYDPLELDPEDMVRLAKEEPRKMTDYSVSDAVATYYLYMQHIHTFVFSLCTILPMHLDDVLRKGTGTLCENLLMIEAFNKRIIYPNKIMASETKMYEGHILDSETYVGGHVEAIESGVFRNDIPIKFRMDSTAFEELKAKTRHILEYAAAEECHLKLEDITNFDEVCDAIIAKLEDLRTTGLDQDGKSNRVETPLIVHLDVAAMYPNIILTNRLQPFAISNDETCAACLYNRDENNCKRRLKWVWRGDYIPATRSDCAYIKAQLESERITLPDGKTGAFTDLTEAQQAEKLKARLKDYSRKIYKRSHITIEKSREDIVCMRENNFYIETVKAFRDRRYVYKGLLKEWKGKESAAAKKGNAEECEECGKMVVMYDSMQLAHKCILNSFYGYVMRKGSRWMSIQMAGIVTHTGLNIITRTRELIQRIGRPLELDTDGIWCALPASFPYGYSFLTKAGKKSNFFFPCVMLNSMVYDNFANHQYQTLRPDGSGYDTHTECSIGFELDGPYKAMLLPAAKEKDKKLKKRYVVFGLNGSIAEMKGFELKRRGELKLIKVFQAEIFSQFLSGKTLDECYKSVAKITNDWLDILDTQGCNMEDDDLLDLLTESSNMSKKLETYGGQKTAQVTTAKRLAELLGDQVVQSEGLKCAYIIANKPYGGSVTERAVPITIFLTDMATRRQFLSKWLKFNGTDEEFSLKQILDWEYYWKRLESCIQKGVSNPIPRIKNPEWLEKQAREANDKKKQAFLVDMFKGAGESAPLLDNAKLFRNMKFLESLGKTNDPAVEAVATVETADEDAGVPLKKVKIARQQKIENMLMPYKPMPARRVDVFFQRQFQDIMSKNWVILQISEPKNLSGEFRMWILVDGIVHQITLDVPRTFYVNYFNDINPEDDSIGSSYAAKALFMTLPRSKSGGVLYKYTMSEEEFQSRQKIISELQTNPNVEGVYETQVPPIMRVLSKLGCVCRVSQSAKHQRDIQRMALKDLEFVNVSNVAYFNEPLKTIYIYHRKCRVGRGYISVLGIYFTNEKQAYIYTVSSGQGNPPATARVAADGFEVVSERFSLLEDAYKEAENVIRDFYAKGHLSYILVVNAPFSERELEETIPATANYPKLYQPCDRRASETVVLKWEAEELAKMHKEFRCLGPWILDKVKTSHFGHVPIGNIGEDEIVAVSDIMFARELQQNNHILWISQSNRPDLGGAQEDDNSLAASSFSSEELSKEICAPGCYKTVCAEVAFSELTLSALMKAKNIIEGEGIASIFAFTDNLDEPFAGSSGSMAKDLMTAKTFGGSIEGIRPFKELVKLVHSWMNSSPDDDDVMVKFLGNLYRWMTSTHSRLYEPAIIRIVTDFMNKLFLQLIHTIRTLGGGIVYANFNKIVINTHKYSREDAEKFITFVKDSVKKESIYSSIDLRVKYYWDVLLFMDLNNYCGVIFEPCAEPNTAILPDRNDFDNGSRKEREGYEEEDDILAPMLDGPERSNGKEPAGVDSPPTQELGEQPQKRNEVTYNKCQWSIAEYLPVEFQDVFSNAILSFVGAIVSKKASSKGSYENPSADGLVSIMIASASSEEERAATIASKSAGISEYLSGGTIDEDDDNESKKSVNLSRYSPVDTAFSQEVFNAIHEMKSRFHNVKGGSENDKFNYIQGPDSVKNPLVIFTNLLCQVLSIDKCSENNVSRLKGGILRILGVPMFSPEAEFKITGSSLIISGFICKNCLALKYDKTLLESILVKRLQEKVLGYQVQDIVCTKCKEIKAENAVRRCKECSSLENTNREVSQKSMMEFISTLRTISKMHNMEWLAEVVESYSY